MSNEANFIMQIFEHLELIINYAKRGHVRILDLLLWITTEIARFMQYFHPKISVKNIMIDFPKIIFKLGFGLGK